MAMEILACTSILRVPLFPRPKLRTLGGGRVFCCSGSGKNGESSGLPSGSFPIEWKTSEHINEDQKHRQNMDGETEVKDNHIWQLFREAHQNILYLNRQRLLAIKELDRLKSERDSLLDRIEELEVERLANPLQGGIDKSTVIQELLLRMDSLVLTGMLGTREAFELRKVVMGMRVGIADLFSDSMLKSDAELLAELRSFSGKYTAKCFHIVHISTEMEPVISVGSLAAYVTSISNAMQDKGHVVEVILPKYASLNVDQIQGLREVEAEFYSYFSGQLYANRIWTGIVCGIGVSFIEPVHYSSFFNQERVYGYSDDFKRFAYFSRASLDYIVKSGKQPDVLHIHNWQTSIVGPLFWDVFVNQGLEDTRILLTCQNFESQCLEQPEKLALCGLDPTRLHRPDRLQDNDKTHLVNVLKGGVVYSNKVIVMSSMQPKNEILRSLGYGLEPTLAFHKDKLLIAPFGFDKSIWDPSVDRFLPQCYSADEMEGKSICKIALQKRLGLLEHASRILVGFIFSDASDVDLENLKTLVSMASRKGVQFVFMLVRQTPAANRVLQSLEEELAGEEVKFVNKYDEALLHLILAASDILLCPSFDDPLLQLPLKAMKYGAAPVAIKFSEDKFRHFAEQDADTTYYSQYINNTFANVSLSQAIDELRNNPSQWNRKIRNAMKKDFSWGAESCDIHLSAYTSILTL